MTEHYRKLNECYAVQVFPLDHTHIRKKYPEGIIKIQLNDHKKDYLFSIIGRNPPVMMAEMCCHLSDGHMVALFKLKGILLPF